MLRRRRRGQIPRTLRLSREVVRAALEREPHAAWAMLQVLASRLRGD
jgi:hypothetical protein